MVAPPPIPPSPQQQQEQQQQQQSVTVNVEASGDPVLEHRIFTSVHSVGRQLGYLSAVVEVLLAAVRPDHPAGSPAAQAIDDFEEAQADILRAKEIRKAERILEDLRALDPKNPKNVEQARALRSDLRTWLDAADAAAGPPAPAHA